MTRRVVAEPVEAAKLLAALVASSDDAIISKSMDGIVTSWNAAAEQMFGYSAEEMIGQPIAVLAARGHEEEMPAILDRLRRGDKIDHFETVRRHKNGRDVLVSLTVSPMRDDDGVLVGASKIVRDITARRQAAEALRLAEDRLQEQHRELVHAARLSELGQMAGILAHEVTQPLTAVGTYLGAAQRLLTAGDIVDTVKLFEAVSRAKTQVQRASEVVQRLRSFAKPSDDARRPELLTSLIEEAVALATTDAGARGVTVQCALGSMDRVVFVDRVQIQQVLLNLIRNALDAMDGEARRELRLSTAASDSAVEVIVADTGSGLAPDIEAKLFQPFVTSKSGGMGLGLSICRDIVEGHGGRLWADPNPDGGVSFKFTLRSSAPAI